MEPFEIQLLEDRFQIEPQENGLYRVMQGEVKIGTVYAQAEGGQVVWTTQDQLEEGFVQQIGELITEHNM